MKQLFNKIANLVVEVPSNPSDEAIAPPTSAPATQKTVAQLAEEAHGPGLHEVHVEVPHPPHPGTPPTEQAGTKPASSNPMPVVGSDGQVDFAPIYEAASLPPTTFGAEQALLMLKELPPELPLEVQRLSVRTTLSAIGKQLGVSQETVLTDAARKIAAIHSFAENLERKVSDYAAAMHKEIADLEARIGERRAGISGVESKLREVQDLCKMEAERLDHLVEFLSLDVSPSKYSPPSSPE